MSKMLRMLCMLLVALAVVSPAMAIPGATDRVPGSTLLVPFFETGIDSTVNPHDTLLVVTNWLFANVTFHYTVWDVDGGATALNGNVTLGDLGTWSVAMRDLLATASPAARAQLAETDFYHGFVTIDVVTTSTALNPTQASYPFSDTNALEGFIYYTRLSQGSANGLAMVALESVAATTDAFLTGFYGGSDHREEIDSTARYCAQQLATGAVCNTGSDDADIDRIHLRVFRSTPLSGTSRAIIFTWRPGFIGGPSTYCSVPANSCSTNYVFRQYNEAGAVVHDTTRQLNRAVNIIPSSAIIGSEAGWISMFDVPNAAIDTQVYAFSFNSAAPSGNPNLTWDALFEGYIVP